MSELQASLKDSEERLEEEVKEAKEKLEAISKEQQQKQQQKQQKQQIIATNEGSDRSPEVGGDTPVAPKAFVE